MTAGRGIAHAESARPGGCGSHGIQLWIAQPAATRDGAPAFEHHAELPQVELGGAVASVLVGSLAGTASPARHDTPLVGADLAVQRGTATVPLEPAWEHALVVAQGAVEIDGRTVEPGELAYLGSGRSELELRSTGDGRALLVGGEPFPERVLMWWNFVARTRAEIDGARSGWEQHDERFAAVTTPLARIPAPTTPWAEPTIL
jgi:redox-sensitive bicupin YhaK (pirin superfamily)